MADCTDIIELALALGLLRKSYEQRNMVILEPVTDGRVKQLLEKTKDDITLYTDIADKRYKEIIKECGEPILPDFIQDRALTEEFIISDFADGVRPWLNALSKQCGCSCKAGEGKPLAILEREYQEVVDTFRLIEEAERIVERTEEE